MNADIYLGTPLLELTVHLQGDGSSWEVERAEEGNIGHLDTELLVSAVAVWCHSEDPQIVAEHPSLSISSLAEAMGLPCQMATLV